MPLATLTPPRSSTEDLVTAVVRSRTGGRIRRLTVCIQGDRLVINGQSTSFYDKQLATHAALESARTFIVQNDLVVG
jgi:hypothetical protein